MVPAAAAIPAPMAHIKVVAVKKLAVGFLVGAIGLALSASACIVSGHPWGESVWHQVVGQRILIVYCEKISVECDSME